MIITLSINNSLRVDSLTDLNKLMPLMKEGVDLVLMVHPLNL
ncbi:hypothetical protein [Dubosiella newyorkensis]|nr:hypothetical protein [Dubosiella newyorkensis]